MPENVNRDRDHLYMLEAQQKFPPQNGVFFAARRFFVKWTIASAHRLTDSVYRRPGIVPDYGAY
jgi:hypothetical protein